METNKKLVQAWIASMLLGESVPYSIKGSKKQLTALSEALYATQLFESELSNTCATVESVTEALQRKHRAVQRFEKEFMKSSWPI